MDDKIIDNSLHLKKEYLRKKNILITGGTGSFGNALIDYLKDTDAKFIIYSRDEKKQHDMYISRGNENISYVVGDIRDREKLIQSMKNVDYIFHAAALKQVPTGENFPEEVIKTNIIGTINVIEAAEYCGVTKVVALSTDKAVQPINAYGMSKALTEKIISAHRGQTPVVCLRYGNVLGSRGSVVPLFLDYIKQNKPIPITNPNMTRFILTLDEAVKLALKCLHHGKNGDLYVIKSPACNIKTLVEALEFHYNRELAQKVIGIRPGEKIHETLLTSDEVHRSIIEHDEGMYFARIPPLYKNLGDFYFSGEDYKEPEPFTSANTEQFNATQVLNKIKFAGLL
jgi:UDP-N-acetylglucosamine 4,6-dehydratase/5-epimerase